MWSGTMRCKEIECPSLNVVHEGCYETRRRERSEDLQGKDLQLEHSGNYQYFKILEAKQ